MCLTFEWGGKYHAEMRQQQDLKIEWGDRYCNINISVNSALAILKMRVSIRETLGRHKVHPKQPASEWDKFQVSIIVLGNFLQISKVHWNTLITNI